VNSSTSLARPDDDDDPTVDSLLREKNSMIDGFVDVLPDLANENNSPSQPTIALSVCGRIQRRLTVGTIATVPPQSSQLPSPADRHGVDDYSFPFDRPLPIAILSVAVGREHMLALDSNGVAWGRGASNRGQLGRRKATAAIADEACSALVRLDLPNGYAGKVSVRQVAAGAYHSALLVGAPSVANAVLVSGAGDVGQLGLGSLSDSYSFRPVAGLAVPSSRRITSSEPSPTVLIACGDFHTLALTQTGTVLAFGSNTFGQCGIGSDRAVVSRPTVVPSLFGVPVSALAAGTAHSLALTVGGSVYGWGDNRHGQLGLGEGSGASVSEPVWVHAYVGKRITKITACGDASGALSAQGIAYVAGQGYASATGAPASAPGDATIPVPVALEGALAARISVGYGHVAIITVATDVTPSQLWTFASHGPGQTSAASSDAVVAKLGRMSGATDALPDVSSLFRPTVVPLTSLLPDTDSEVLSDVFAGDGDTYLLTLAPQVLSPTLVTRTEQPCPYLTLESVTPLIEAVEAKRSRDALSILCGVLERGFSSVGSLNQSFLSDEALLPSGDLFPETDLSDKLQHLPEPDDSTVRLAHASGLDLAQVRALYVRLLALQAPQIATSLVKGISTMARAWLSRKRNVVQPEALRCFFIALECPALLKVTDANAPTLTDLVLAVQSLPPRMTTALRIRMQVLPASYMVMQVNVLHRLLDYLYSAGIPRPVTAISGALHCLSLLAAANDVYRELPFEEFHSPCLSASIEGNVQQEVISWRRAPDSSVLRFDALISPSTKAAIMRFDAESQMKQTVETAVITSVFTGQTYQPYLVLVVRRESLVADAVYQLTRRTPAELKKPLRIKFVGEEGVDAGGVQKEFFQLIVSQLLDVQYGMFGFADDDTARELWFQPMSTAEAAEFKLVGQVLGLALYNGVILDLCFPLVLYKKLLGLRVGLSDLCAMQPLVGRSLTRLLDYDGEDMENELCLDFTVSMRYFDTTRIVELCPGGTDKPVTEANAREYVERYVNHVLNSSVNEQFSPFRDGFLSVCGGPALGLCRPEELELLICGDPVLDMEALQAVAGYAGGFSPSSTCVRWLWKIVSELEPVDQRRLLTFATGSDRAPVGGLRKIRFVVQCSGPDSEQLPTSSTCFNVLLLPNYSSEAKLRRKLLHAIREGATGFYLQ